MKHFKVPKRASLGRFVTFYRHENLFTKLPSGPCLIDPDEGVPCAVDEDAPAGGPVREGASAAEKPVPGAEEHPLPKMATFINGFPNGGRFSN
jgi:hypothetical protein